MDPKYTGETLEHLEKLQELLMELSRSMSHEVHKLQVEEEMLMRKFYEIMTAQGFTKKSESKRGRSSDGGERLEPVAPAAGPSEKRSTSTG